MSCRSGVCARRGGGRAPPPPGQATGGAPAAPARPDPLPARKIMLQFSRTARVHTKRRGRMAEERDTRIDSAAEGPDWGDDLFDCDLEFVDNPEPRCLCQLVLDTSRSMEGEPIAALNKGLHVLRDELLQVPLARKRVEVS